MLELARKLIELFETGDVGYSVVGAFITLGLLFLMYLIIRWAASTGRSAAEMTLRLMESFEGVLSRIHDLTEVLDTRIRELSGCIEDDINQGAERAQTLARIEGKMPSKDTVDQILPRLDVLERRIVREIEQVRKELRKEIAGEPGCNPIECAGGPAAPDDWPVGPVAEGSRPLPGAPQP